MYSLARIGAIQSRRRQLLSMSRQVWQLQFGGITVDIPITGCPAIMPHNLIKRPDFTAHQARCLTILAQ
jgi:hypothetical protein